MIYYLAFFSPQLILLFCNYHPIVLNGESFSQFPQYVVYARIIPAMKTVAHCSKSGPPNKWSTFPGSFWSGLEVYICKKRRAGTT